MELWLVVLLFVGGISLMILESMLPGMVLGFIGLALVVTATYFGFTHHWAIGAGQIGFAAVIVPAAFFWGSRRMALKTALSAEEGVVSFSVDWAVYLGKEGEAVTPLRPAGVVRVEGKKVDVVTAGEMIEKGKQVRVVKVEGNRVIVREI